MDGWDLLVALVAGYVAVVSLVRLMANRRNELLDKIRAEIAKQRDAAASAEDESEPKEEAA
jgi:hypothetical protein